MGDNHYSILPANWRDLATLRQLEQACFGEDAWPLFDLIGILTFPGIIRLKAVNEQGEMIGFVGGDPRQDQAIGWITTIGVFPQYRRLGIATALLLACEEQMHMPRVRLSVRRSNQKAINLYEKKDYHVVDVWPNYYVGGEDALVMEKKFLQNT